MASYVKIPKRQFNLFMALEGFTCLNPDQAQQEFVYYKTWNDEEYMLKVYSSITDIGDARGVGADAIRLVLATRQDGKYIPCAKGKRVHRVKGWRENLGERIAHMEYVGCMDKDWQCENCGGHLLVRTGKRGDFYGCENFPEMRGGCRYTRGM